MFLTTDIMDTRTDECENESSAPDGARGPASEADVVVFVTLIDHGDLTVEPDSLF